MHRAFLASVLLAAIAPLAAAGDAGAPLRVVLISGAEEYDSDASLASFKSHIEGTYPVKATLLKAQGVDKLPGLEALDDCDVALFFTRRLTISGEPLERIQRYVKEGRPIVAVRTASHGFQNWLAFDKEVLGGNYRGHYRNDLTMRAKADPAASGHPALAGVGMIASRGSLYRTGPVAEGAKVLMVGTSPEGSEPATWVRERNGARVFYTSVGAQGDFENASYLRLLTNALFWAARREAPRPAEPFVSPRPKPEGSLHLSLRTRTQAPGSGEWREQTVERDVPVAETAIVICDMWDKHWCDGATARCDEIAKRMADVVEAARRKGVQIVHAPSDCMDFYAGTPQRRLMKLAPAVAPPKAREIKDPPLPIDDSDGGCDTANSMYLAWTRQTPRIAIGPHDGISDSGAEVYNLFRQLGIKTVIVMGVHTNMCVLNRSFAIRQMTRWGMDCILARDLTDTMYNPAMAPKVPHARGTDLVVEHIEKYWCPSATAADILSALPR